MTTIAKAARPTVWMVLPLTDDGGVSYGLFLRVAGRVFVCPETFETRAAVEKAGRAVQEGLGRTT